jgi:hypothetical protein
MSTVPPLQPKPSQQRRKRAAAALRANLRRRKQGELGEVPDNSGEAIEKPEKPHLDSPQD